MCTTRDWLDNCKPAAGPKPANELFTGGESPASFFDCGALPPGKHISSSDVTFDRELLQAEPVCSKVGASFFGLRNFGLSGGVLASRDPPTSFDACWDWTELQLERALPHKDATRPGPKSLQLLEGESADSSFGFSDVSFCFSSSCTDTFGIGVLISSGVAVLLREPDSSASSSVTARGILTAMWTDSSEANEEFTEVCRMLSG
jgi:hypothetical protein